MLQNIGSFIILLVSLNLLAFNSAAEAETNADNKLSLSGDAAKGKRIFNSCLRCHTVEESSLTKVGPDLRDIVGRKVGTLNGFRYSAALKSADFVWSEEKLDNWLREPRTFLPGNRMTFAGIDSEQERMDLLAYIKQVTTSNDDS